MRTPRWRSSHAPAVLLLFVLACTEPTNEPLSPSLSNNPLELASPGWQEQARTLVSAGNLAATTAGRVYALLSIAQYAGVVDATEYASEAESQNPSGLGAGGRTLAELQRGAVAGASAEILGFLFSSAKTALEARLDSEAAAVPKGLAGFFEQGETLGRAAGQMMVAWAQADGFSTPVSLTPPPPGAGVWIANGPPAGSQLPSMKPYFLTSTAQFHAPPPPPFGSAAFLTDLNEVIQISQARTAAQLASAQLWNYPGGTFTPPGFWNLQAASYAEEANLNELDATHLFALMHGAMLDAQLGCWETKYTEWFMRPSQAATFLGLTAITLPIGLPNHPSYPSGHSCVSSSAATVLASVFPDKAAEVGQLMVEAGLSRIYAGIHYRFDVIAGQTLGRNVANAAIAYDQANGLLDAVR